MNGDKSQAYGFGMTEQVQTQTALRESEERYRSLVELSPDAVVVHRDGKIVFINTFGAQAVGASSPEELIGRPVIEFVHPDYRESVKERIQQMAKDGMAPRVEEKFLRLDGTSFNVEVAAKPITFEGQPAFQVIAHDVTGRKQAEQEHRRLEAQIQHAQKLESLGVLAGGIAHDFNNLLTGILGNASLARMDVSPDSSTHECLEDIEKAAKRAADLCNQMLAYSGKGKFVTAPVRLCTVAKEMTDLLNAAISKKAELKYDFAPNLLAIQADATQIRQVIMNLVTNASDAIGDNPGVITLRTGKTFCDECFFREVYLGSELPTGAYVYLAVSDTGCGMAAETQAKIFEPFFTTKFTGRGLGLASVLGIVRGHHGTIKIESQPGHGTTFTILFPCPDQATEAFAGDADTAEEWHGSGVILVVDDERTIRDLSRRVLEHAGFTVLTAADGSEAVRCFREHGNEISAILLDMTMPGLNGEETLQELRCLPHGEQARVILSSGFSEGEAGERFVGKGLAGFLHKPYTAKELIAKVQMALEDFEY